jgi:DMSO reductase anchor subunit
MFLFSSAMTIVFLLAATIAGLAALAEFKNIITALIVFVITLMLGPIVVYIILPSAIIVALFMTLCAILLQIAEERSRER